MDGIRPELGKVYEGDVVDVLSKWPSNFVDSVVTDPPYGLEFMDMEWDRLGGKGTRRKGGGGMWHEGGGDAPPIYIGGVKAQDWHLRWAKGVIRVLKPGGHLLSFGGTRTYHRMVCAVEDAGFEVRDMINWVYSSGYPKGKDLGNGWNTALRPAHEPIVVARKRVSEQTIGGNVIKHRTGGLNVGACRVPVGGVRKPKFPVGYYGMTNFRPVLRVGDGDPDSRYPTNFIHDGSLGIVSGLGKNAGYFYCAKADTDERDLGLAGFDKRDAGVYKFRRDGSLDGGIPSRRNTHPTVKPVELMRYLVRLVTPVGGLVLDPFIGSGTTAIACLLEGFRYLGVELNSEYVKIARSRVAEWSRKVPLGV